VDTWLGLSAIGNAPRLLILKHVSNTIHTENENEASLEAIFSVKKRSLLDNYRERTYGMLPANIGAPREMKLVG